MKRVFSVMAAGAAFVLTGCADTGSSAAGGDSAPIAAAANVYEQQEQERAGLLLQYDANQDGAVSRAEMEAGVLAEFTAADLDGDGKLNGAERRTVNDLRATRGEDSPLIDWNADGGVDFKEYSNVPISMFARLDKNSNDEVSEGEFAGIRIKPVPNTKAATLTPASPEGKGSAPGAVQTQSAVPGN